MCHSTKSGNILSLGPGACHDSSVLWHSTVVADNARDKKTARIVFESNGEKRKSKE